MLKSFKHSSTLEAMWLSGALDKTPCVGGAE